MPRFAANLTLLFTELPYAERFAAAAAAGFGAVEVLFPYDHPAEVTAQALRAQGLPLVLMNATWPDAETGQLGHAATPARQERFRTEMARVLEYAAILKPQMIHVMSGEGAGDAATDCFVQNLIWTCEQAPAQQFTIEPLNPQDRPDYLMTSYALAAEVLDRVARPNLGLQYDTYHAQRITGDALACWHTYRNRIVHAQIGNTPDRREPGPGEIDFDRFFATLDSDGYDGWVSAEYNPSTNTAGTLGWMGSASIG